MMYSLDRSDMNTLIKNGTIINAQGIRKADILCRGETIAAIAPDLSPGAPCTVLDAGDKYIFPGFIDPHVHVYLPSGEVLAKDNYETAGKAALLGGTTTILDFILPRRDQAPLEALDRWHREASGKATCDYGFHLAITDLNQQKVAQIRSIVDNEGITSFKIHLAYKNVLSVSDEVLYNTLKLGSDVGALTMAHCENAELIEQQQRALILENKTHHRWHAKTRPPSVEALGTKHFLTFASMLHAPAYVVHLSCRQALAEAMPFINSDTPVWIESLIQFLILSGELAEQEDFEGAKYVMSPPLRSKQDNDALWNALQKGIISTVGTDHAPFDFHGQKDLGRNDFTRIPNGLPGIQDRIHLLYHFGVHANRISLQQLVDVAARMPARLFGLYPKKGTLQPGSDADIVIFDPTASHTLSAKTHAMNVDYNPYEGQTVQGHVDHVFLRGRHVVQNGMHQGSPGDGKFINRTIPDLSAKRL